MKVTFKTDELTKRLSQLGAVVDKKANVKLYSYIRLFTYAGEAGLGVGIMGAATDAALTLFLPKEAAQADGEVDTLLPFEKLTDILAPVTAKETTIQVDGTAVTLKAAKLTARLKTIPLDTQWPTQDRPEQVKATLGLPGFLEQIAQVDFAVPAANGKYVVASAKLEGKSKGDNEFGYVKLVGTDGWRLAISTVAQDAGTFDLTLPKTALDRIKHLTGATVSVYEDAERGFYFQTDNEVLTVTHTVGVFPDYTKVVPSIPPRTVITVKKPALEEAVRSIRPLADPDSPQILFDVIEGGLVLTAVSDEAAPDEAGGVFRNQANTDIEATVAGPAVQFALNASYLEPFLASATGDITIGVQRHDAVVDFNTAGEGKSYRYLQMPMQIKPLAAAPVAPAPATK
jgi:DNA polymerase III sliding clamp (beta) subunit (PCNA family)